jgi:hypothetical protein
VVALTVNLLRRSPTNPPLNEIWMQEIENCFLRNQSSRRVFSAKPRA